MKKFLIAALATTTAVSAHAGTINFDARADYDSKTYDESNLADTSQFYFKTVRLDYQGKATDDLTFRLRAAYNKAGTATTGAGDNSQTALEFAYLTHKMGDMFSLQVGKLGSEYGAIESQTSGADLYLTSQAYTKQGVVGIGATNSSTLVGGYLSTSSLLYVMGAKLIFNMTPDQNLSLVVFKTPDVATSGAVAPAATTSNAMMEGLIYKGLFMDKNLRVMASYHMGTGNVPSTDDKFTLYSAGITYNFGGYVLAGVDYTNSAYERDGDGAKDSIYSIIGKVAYTGWEQWVPRLEVIASEEKVETNATAANNGTNKFMGYGAVVEYKPIADTTFRYHIAYSNTTEKFDGRTTNPADAKVDQITVGARWNADFLK
ncbi:porin [Bdellovibrio sp. HCB290]|uniref:porin n=1 Tax=Bdellovibrio sp. HCB290 TaxID=3394356 RepID=UPI0039B4228B